MPSFVSSSSSLLHQTHPLCHYFSPKFNKFKLQNLSPSLSVSATSSQNDTSGNSTKLVTFLGKGGSGKTTSSVFAAQHYAAAGLRTCLVIQSQDPTADYLLNCKIGNSPVMCNDNLSAIRLETTKMLLEPLSQLKQADTRLNLTQGVLGGIVGEELGVLPAMDSIFAAFRLARLVGLLENVGQNSSRKDKFDVIIYDGVGTDETLRMIGAASKARLYLRYLRNLAEKTDLGRLVGPSILTLIDEAMSLTGRSSSLNGKMSVEIWEALEKMLERGSTAFNDPCKFGCSLVMDPGNKISVDSALRYWGCTIQAGSQVSGAIGIPLPHLSAETMEELKNKFSPLPFAFLPHISTSHAINWNSIMLHTVSQDTRMLLSSPASSSDRITSPVTFDMAKRSITLFLPGFDKSEIKLYQYRGGSELLVEAGDQRRIINLPQKIQGKVGGAKFVEKSLIITMK